MVVAPAEWHRRRNNTEIGIQREGASPVSSIVSSEWRHGEQQLLSLVPPMVLLRRQASSFAVGHPDTVVHPHTLTDGCYDEITIHAAMLPCPCHAVPRSSRAGAISTKAIPAPGRGVDEQLVWYSGLLESWVFGGPLGPVPTSWRESKEPQPMRLSVISKNGTQDGYLVEHANQPPFFAYLRLALLTSPE
ncbi:hypothetical protein CABS01_12335 [Colletotrichum abscissum]|uniref:Uncharacterized protein n=2 Tax=Colletotrichum acutatum species complex TaxID=2707335 RepID=A0AAI9Z3Q7_9PEZI|nr:uncharacterized protein CCOS01_02845 [Colletotrichum costaricense]XP_060387137.1 uncharacterized protein CTAM01_02466 [Colletotrichum tamarilloi]XP_060396546.1 uncharacterized protein CABS01_12335 [Colletotrichum abscissum]KAI3552667.1 hypothetical protein CSPX01_00416 [Colletotrichum filicis]KAK1490535.1 hypothetical protein CABS01_12335 [Colletotrichum abscissum]KAK1508680.1 hypothetical protein CTAM01_02466 [Colletotrichum tamarilloi]KAK1534093.1 hypothetical protein CCOS01_02845 [Colle